MGGGPRLQVHSAYGSVSRLPESKAESIGTGASHHSTLGPILVLKGSLWIFTDLVVFGV